MSFWKKNQTLLFLNTAADTTTAVWARIGLSTVLSIAVNPVSNDYDFIKDENPTTIVENYQPSISQEIMAKEGDSCFDYIWGIFYDLPVGTGVETDCLVVYPKAGATASSFEAWKSKVTLVLGEFDAVAKKVTFDIKFAGDITQGTVTVTSGVPTFTAEA